MTFTPSPTELRALEFHPSPALSPVRAARLAELRAKFAALHLQRCALLRIAVQETLGPEWVVDSWPIRGCSPTDVAGYRVIASTADGSRYMATRIDVGAWAPQAPNHAADHYRRSLRPNPKG